MATSLPGTDVVVIGLGAAGGVAVLPLAEAGLDIVGLEAGSRLTSKDFAPDELRNNVRDWPFAVQKAMQEIPTLRRNRSAQAFQSPGQPMMNGVGGTSLHYWGQSWRLNPWDFKVVSETTRRARRWRTGRSAMRSWSRITTVWSTRSACLGRRGTSKARSISEATRSKGPEHVSIRCRRFAGPAFWKRWVTPPVH